MLGRLDSKTDLEKDLPKKDLDEEISPQDIEVGELLDFAICSMVIDVMVNSQMFKASYFILSHF